MIHSVRFTAVLDTNVIYPVIIRDLLLWFAHYDLYTPKWSANIFDEWKTVMIRRGISEEEAEKRAQAPNRAFPDAFVACSSVLLFHGFKPTGTTTKLLLRMHGITEKI